MSLSDHKHSGAEVIQYGAYGCAICLAKELAAEREARDRSRIKVMELDRRLDAMHQRADTAESKLAEAKLAVDEVGQYISDDQGFLIDQNGAQCVCCDNKAKESSDIKHDIGCLTKAWQDLLSAVSSTNPPAILKEVEELRRLNEIASHQIPELKAAIRLMREALTDISKLSDDQMIANIAKNALEGK